MNKEQKIKKSFFQVKEKNSTYFKEILSGIIVFLAMIYILPTNTDILSSEYGAGMSKAAVFIATALASGITTLIMGLFAKFPIALSAGMGINAFFSFTVCSSLGYTWEEALTITLISGVVFLIITITPIRKKIIEAIPADLKNAIIVGLGAFIALVGLTRGGIIQDDASTLIKLGDFKDPSVLLALFGIIIVFIFMNVKGKISSFAIAIALAITAIVGYILGLCGVANMPTFDTSTYSVSAIKETFGKAFFHFDIFLDPKIYAIIFSFTFVNLFDTTGTLIAVGSQTGMISENGELVGGKKVLLVDAFGAVISGVLGTSPVTSFVESNVGIESGAKTGLSSTITGILFILSIFLYPVFSIFNFSCVTSLALVAVGAMMFGDLKNINWNDKIIVATTFLIVILMVLCYSITDGIGIGLIIYCFMMLASKRGKEVNIVVYIMAIFFVINYAVSALI